jgi:FMN phosphatase YigB (HAD superfamily)
LKPRICHLVALSDATHDILSRSSSFSALAPYFSEVFTSDDSHAYRPDSAAFDPSLKYHDALGIPHQQRCLVSNSLLRELEAARQLGVPAIWMCHPQSLAGRRVLSTEYSFPREICRDFVHLRSLILGENRRVPQSR